MSNFKEHSIGKLIAVILAAVILLPLSVKLAHALENHKHEVCTSKDAKHIHEIDHDCEFYKFKLSNAVTFTTQNYDIVELNEPKLKVTNYYQFLSEYQKLHFKLRGPPQLI